MGQSQLQYLLAGLLIWTVSILGSGCDLSIGHDIDPFPPPQVGGPGPAGPDFYRDHVRIRVDRTDLFRLKHLNLDHPAAIRIQPSLTGSLVAEFAIDLQKADFQNLLTQYEQEAKQLSSANEKDVQIVLPPRTCQEQKNSAGNLVGISGLCIRELTLYIPNDIPFDLNLSWQGELHIAHIALGEVTLRAPTSGAAYLENASVERVILTSGDGNGALTDFGFFASKLLSLIPDSGGFSADLVSIKQISLDQVAGHLHIDLSDSTSAKVAVDGTPITSFPFDN